MLAPQYQSVQDHVICHPITGLVSTTHACADQTVILEVCIIFLNDYQIVCCFKQSISMNCKILFFKFFFQLQVGIRVKQTKPEFYTCIVKSYYLLCIYTVCFMSASVTLDFVHFLQAIQTQYLQASFTVDFPLQPAPRRTTVAATARPTTSTITTASTEDARVESSVTTENLQYKRKSIKPPQMQPFYCVKIFYLYIISKT